MLSHSTCLHCDTACHASPKMVYFWQSACFPLQVPDTVEAAIREADVLDQDGNISLEEFEALMHSADTDVLDLFDTRHHI